MDLADSMLQTILPVANINLSIIPRHPPQSVSYIILELPFIDITIWPFVNTIAIAFIIFVLAFELFSI